jgi:predicted SnoaL-like aldol condensation-catalyzing enzyme
MTLVAVVVAAMLLSGCAMVGGERSSSPPPPGSTAAVAANKKVVVDFYRTVFIEKKVREGFERYVAPDYIEHSPHVRPNRDAILKALSQRVTKESIADMKRVIAEGDLVVLHVHARNNLQDRGRAVVEIFRVAHGRIVEHWDVVQPVPPRLANTNSMF